MASRSEFQVTIPAKSEETANIGQVLREAYYCENKEAPKQCSAHLYEIVQYLLAV